MLKILNREISFVLDNRELFVVLGVLEVRIVKRF